MPESEAQLRDLARDRRLVTPELHEANDYYGHATVLKAYAGLPPNHSLKAVIEHGPPIAGRWLWNPDVLSRLPVVLCASARRAREFTEVMAASREAIPIGPPIAYTDGGLSPDPPAERRLLVFPLHSSHLYTTEFDIDGFAAMIEREGAGFDSVEVCLYWRDVLLGAAEPYRARGFDCSTAGHMFDPEFLPRFREIVTRATAVVTNGIGTHLLYAALLDRPTWLVGETARDRRPAGSRAAANVAGGFDEAAFKAVTGAFENPTDSLTPSQREIVAEFTGAEHVHSPDALREILHDADERYRRAVPAWRRLVSATRRQWLWRAGRLRRWSV